MSIAAYKVEDPNKYLNESSTYHSLGRVCAISSNSDQGVILATGTVGGKNTLYIAYKGTTTLEDMITDCDIELMDSPLIPGGKFHSGFYKRAETVTIDQILYCAKQEECQEIVTCGHSLGGAVACISAIRLMKHLGSKSEISVHNITFGAPFFANEAVRFACKTEKMDRHMLHYVGHQDIVPALLSLGHTVQILQSKLNEMTG